MTASIKIHLRLGDATLKSGAASFDDYIGMDNAFLG